MNRLLKRAVIFIFCGVFLIFGCEELMRRCVGGFAGSYPFVESWDINGKESDVIEVIKEINFEDSLKHSRKTELLSISKRDTVYDWLSPEMLEYRKQQAKDSTISLPKYNEHNSHPDYWLFIDFFYTDTRQRVHTWTRPDIDSTKTTLALISIYGFDGYSDEKLINRDFWYFENKRQIEKFKTLIVDRINAKIHKRKERL